MKRRRKKPTAKVYASQGDVSFLRVPRLRSLRGLKRKPDGVLALGEVTGHSHRLATLDAAELYDMGDGKQLLRVGPEGVSIVHEEHGTVTLPEGDFEVKIDREYTDEGEQRVVD